MKFVDIEPSTISTEPRLALPDAQRAALITCISLLPVASGGLVPIEFAADSWPESVQLLLLAPCAIIGCGCLPRAVIVIDGDDDEFDLKSKATRCLTDPLCCCCCCCCRLLPVEAPGPALAPAPIELAAELVAMLLVAAPVAPHSVDEKLLPPPLQALLLLPLPLAAMDVGTPVDRKWSCGRSSGR